MAENKNSFTTVVRSLMDGAGASISAKTVVGDPVIVGDTTIIPLSDVTIGCAAGSNTADRRDSGNGGFAAKMSPSAVLIIKGGNVKVINIKNQDSIAKFVDMVPDLVDKFTAGKADMMDDDDAIEYAFPEENKDKKKSPKETK